MLCFHPSPWLFYVSSISPNGVGWKAPAFLLSLEAVRRAFLGRCLGENSNWIVWTFAELSYFSPFSSSVTNLTTSLAKRCGSCFPLGEVTQKEHLDDSNPSSRSRDLRWELCKIRKKWHERECSEDCLLKHWFIHAAVASQRMYK